MRGTSFMNTRVVLSFPSLQEGVGSKSDFYSEGIIPSFTSECFVKSEWYCVAGPVVPWWSSGRRCVLPGHVVFVPVHLCDVYEDPVWRRHNRKLIFWLFFLSAE